jgi:uncharacterized protein (TIGR03437 family)
MKHSIRLAVLTVTLSGLLGFALRIPRGATAQQPTSSTVYAVTAGNKLISFSAATPGTIASSVNLTGLAQGETLTGIDFRPRTNVLYGVSSASRVYTINLSTGAATAVGSGAFTPALSGTSFGVDFNPVPDRIRVVSDSDQNLRLDPVAGTVAATDATLAYATGDPNAAANPSIAGVAYTNDFNGASSTTLYGIDSNLDVLVRQGSVGGAPDSPNNGKLTTIGPLGFNTGDQVGFDITAPNDVAYASLTAQGANSSSLYSINLNTGAATLIGAIGGGAAIRDIAIPVTFVPTAQQAGFAVVNAASYSADSLAPEAIAAVFGPFQTQNNQTASASALPLPTTLAGMKVSVNGVDAGLFFVGPGQINLRVPGSVQDGAAVFTVTDSAGATRSGTVSINRAAPGLFAANSSGFGTAAAFTTADGAAFQSVFNPDFSERPIDPGTKAKPNYLVLFGTGISNARADNPGDANGIAEAVTVTIQGVPAPVTFAGKHPTFQSLDQVNVQIPPELSGAGKVRVRLLVNGQASNFVTVTIGGAPPAVNLKTIAAGQSIGGALSADDQVLRDDAGRTFFFDAYHFTATAGSGVAVDVRSTVFNAAAVLFKRRPDGSLAAVATDDDLGGLGDGDIVNGNALLLTVIQESGDYVIFVTSAETDEDAVGGYTVRLTGAAVQQTTVGANVSGSIASGDLQTAAGDYLDAYWFAGLAGDPVQIKLSSTSFDPLLILNQNTGETLAVDDNSGGGASGKDAQITQTLPETGVYVVVATPLAPNVTGPYTLSLARPAGLGAGARAEIEAESLLRQPARGLTLRRISPNAEDARLDSRFVRLTSRRVVTQ